MSELIEKLRKLAQHVDCFSTSGHCVLCQIESLTPEIEAALAHEKEQRAGNLEAWKAACASLVLVTEKLAAFKADLAALTEKMAVTEDTSDGFHTFKELYDHRHALFSAVVAAYGGWKSLHHHDGSMFDGWFIAGVRTPQGDATYHLPLSLYASFPGEELEHAPEWDGHTPYDAAYRIARLASAACADRDARVRLEITALLRMAAEAVKGTAGHSAVAVQKVLALIPAADASALDTYVEEQLASELNITAVKLLLTAEGWLTPESVQEKVADLEHAALDVIEWENEYRRLNNLGKYPPSPFMRLSIVLGQAASPGGDSGGAK